DRTRLIGLVTANAVLVVTSSVIADTRTREGLEKLFESANVGVSMVRFDRDPDDLAGDELASAPHGRYREASPDAVNAIVAHPRAKRPDGVVAIGGGSTIDTGKALAAAFVEGVPVETLLEGGGTRPPSGRRLPFVAVPTTAGTGSEATKNAVLSRPGPDGFKKSLRHDNFVPDLALIDPLLHLSCPSDVTAASGLDAITQLLEAYVSTRATPLTDALALDGLAAAGRSYLRAVGRGESDVDARAGMAYAAYLSGVCLASAGLGTVHGLAGPAGAFTSVPHGLFCGLLLPHVTRRTVDALQGRRDALGVLGKYAAAGRALTGRTTGSLEDQIEMLVDRLSEFARAGSLPGLRAFGFNDEAARRVAGAGDNKTNPYAFSVEERTSLIGAAL
ncbi:MAG: iron-containing alcohol dehydrogenase, partial [Spirochaetota bacterium]